MTAADLCEELRISSGAVSSAVKRLIPTGMIEHVPAPGSRRDHYRFREHAWATLMSSQNEILAVMGDAAAEGIKEAGADSVAGRRLHEMQDFSAFTWREMTALIDHWREQYDAGRWQQPPVPFTGSDQRQGRSGPRLRRCRKRPCAASVWVTT
ncbi:hypothetical protein SVIO_065400 [Streptomyces violaceusniger]|uniref:HTH marR-type domain-containing protein n=2 Tax=Streptomyces violaceusniger TaxID=68280 RepID=A0A4D4LBH2_STRVO|nr:hypothetical protein SVIO_065400 [Streptomyces violaceusniger]